MTAFIRLRVMNFPSSNWSQGFICSSRRCSSFPRRRKISQAQGYERRPGPNLKSRPPPIRSPASGTCSTATARSRKPSKGSITVAAKKGDAYPVTFDLTSGGGPSWTGVGVYKEGSGDKNFWTAYGTPKTVGLCVYEIDGGNLKGTWYPWYIDGDAKNTGTEELKGPPTLDGDFTITSANAPTAAPPIPAR